MPMHIVSNTTGCSKLTLIRIDVWAESFTKLLAFNQTQYKRLLVLDSDATLLKHMDELFFIPSRTAALPRAYWLDKPLLTSSVMVLEPSAKEFARVQKSIENAEYGTYDMDIMNTLYGNDCSVLPHRKYLLLTGQFRSKSHVEYMGREKWDPVVAIKEAKFVHFSDYPIPKPWYQASWQEVEKSQPDCELDDSRVDHCQARYIWLDLYEDFKERRKVKVTTPVWHQLANKISKRVCDLDLGEDPRH
jgi:alpha-N-acetylglucosamine transferase